MPASLPAYADFQERIGAVNDVLNAMSILQWDQRTMMPPGGVETRSKQIATLVSVARELLLSDETRRKLDAAAQEVASLPADAAERRAVSQTEASIAFHSRIPAALQKRRAELKSIANAVWIKARDDNDFQLFSPYVFHPG